MNMRVAPTLNFQLRGIQIIVSGVRHDVPPKMQSISYETIAETDESDARLELLRKNVQRYGTVFITVSPGTDLTGKLGRK